MREAIKAVAVFEVTLAIPLRPHLLAERRAATAGQLAD